MGSIRRAPSGGWQARWREPGSIAVRARTFPRRRDAEAFLSRVESSKLEGSYIDPALARRSFGSWAGEWLGTTTHLRPSSRARVEGILRAQLLPRFDSRPLGSIKTTDVRAFVSELHGQELAPATVRKTYNVLKAILRAAEESGLIGRSPCIGIRLPQPRRIEPRFLTPQDVTRLAEAIVPRYRALVLLGAYGGLRFGELAGLRLERVDFLRSRLTVQDTIVEVGGRLHRGPTKTGPARLVTLPRTVTEALSLHVAEHPPGPEGLVFTAPQGGPLSRTRFRQRVWIPAIQRAGLEPLRMHDLRHTAAALAIHAGAHPRAIMERLGHASVTTTLNTYGHLFPAVDEQLADRLDNMASAGADGPGVARVWPAETSSASSGGTSTS